jgi:hypothetical protein
MDYLKIARASEIKETKDRIIYRIFEILPGFLSWGVLFLALLLSWLRPFWIAVFIIVFTIFWFLRTIYFSLHMWFGYKEMRKNEKIDWMKRVRMIENWQRIYHLVVVPVYKESFQVIRGNFNSLAMADYPKDKMIVVLACEERARKDMEKTAEEIKREFSSVFFKFLITYHPSDIKGEIAGKGSNETWAAKTAKREITDKLDIPLEDIIFSSFDADTCVFPQYFSCLAYNYLTSEKPSRTSFQPVPLYINNIWQAPVFSRIFSFSSTFWHTMNQERPEKLVTFSSHSMSFKALVEVGFKQTNIVADDSRIFWQCFLKYNGDYRVRPLYYPVSMDSNAAKNTFRTLVNIYKQQRRWAYGAEDIPFFLFGFLKNKKIPLGEKIKRAAELIEGHSSWATASILILVLGWLPITLGTADFTQTIMSYSLPRTISRIMTLAMAGLVFSIYVSFLLLPPRPPEYGKWKYAVFLFGWVFFPINMIFFGSLPALDAQTRLMLGKYMGFWVTEKFRKE